jgi:hypothetical protein
MKKYNCKVILCGPAVGKTYLSNHDNRFVDIDDMRAKYKYNIQNQSNEEFEKGKSNRGKIVNNDSLEYAKNLLDNTIRSGRIALISYQEELLQYVIDNKIDYCLVYADISLRKEYKMRMEQRGNIKKFVDDMTNEKAWEEFYFINENDNKPKYKIKLKKGQYLSDLIDYFV